MDDTLSNFSFTNFEIMLINNKLSQIEEKNRNNEFIRKLGFNKSFAKICSEYNRIGEDEKYSRTPEGDILELVDNFGGMLLHRPERKGFPLDEALILLKYRNFKDKENQYLSEFVDFVKNEEGVTI